MLARLIAFFFVGVLYAAGPILLLIAIASSIPGFHLIRTGIGADATIIEFNRIYLPRRSKEAYLPVFKFAGNDGRTYTIMADSNANWVAFKVGDHVPIRYLKDHPETARIATVPQLWMPQLILAFFGSLFTVFSWRVYKRRSNTARPDIPVTD